jgi:hypothetical protein
LPQTTNTVHVSFTNGQEMLLTGVTKMEITDYDVCIYSGVVFVLKSKKLIRSVRFV